MRPKHGKLVLYVRLKKSLDGILHASLLFWKKLTKLLESWGFQFNPYNQCIDKIINEKQCTVLWHVNYLKISHVDYGINITIIEKLTEEFRKGSVHDYLCMSLEY